MSCTNSTTAPTLPRVTVWRSCREGAIPLQNTPRPSALRLRAHLSELRRLRTEREEGLLPVYNSHLMVPAQGMVHTQIGDTPEITGVFTAVPSFSQIRSRDLPRLVGTSG